MENENKLRLNKFNLYLIAAGVVVIIIGFILMMVGPVSHEGVFEPDIFSTRRIVVAPILVFLGYVSVIFAILYQPKKK